MQCCLSTEGVPASRQLRFHRSSPFVLPPRLHRDRPSPWAPDAEVKLVRGGFPVSANGKRGRVSGIAQLGRLHDVHRAPRLVCDGVGHAPEHATAHAPIANHQQVGVALLGQSNEHLGGLALIDHRGAVDPPLAEILLGPAHDLAHPSMLVGRPLVAPTSQSNRRKGRARPGRRSGERASRRGVARSQRPPLPPRTP
jgi:hypothetical protein